MRPFSTPNKELDQWFTTEIIPHEGALTRYLRRAWSNASEIADLRQDIYVRIYQSALKDRPNSPKAFLFATARNLLADRIRRSRIISIDYTQDLDSLNVLRDEISPERRLNARQELQRFIEAFEKLPDRTREVVWLRRIEGLSQREAAARLGILEMTLAGYLSKGLRGLARHVLGDAPQAGEDGDVEISAQNERG